MIVTGRDSGATCALNLYGRPEELTPTSGGDRDWNQFGITNPLYKNRTDASWVAATLDAHFVPGGQKQKGPRNSEEALKRVTGPPFST